MNVIGKSLVLFGTVALLSGCAGAAQSPTGSEASSDAAESSVNEGFLRACLFFKNQTGYQPMGESFYAENRAATLASWTDGLSDAQAQEVEDFFAPYDEEWARSMIVSMAIDGAVAESKEWMDIQIKCLANEIEVEFPSKVY